MNDRVSQKPPVPYLGTDEDLLEEYQAEQEAYNNRKGKPRPTSCVPSTTGQSDTSRHSSIFRFGKTIAASFNPSNWKLFKSQPEPEEMETPQQRILRERQAKAEKIYAELKQSGHFPNVRTQSFDAFGASSSAHKHDSGVEFAESNPRYSVESSVGTEEKRKGRVFLEPPNLSHSHRAETPSSVAPSTVYSNTSSPSKTFSHFKKNSLSNIKKRFTSDGGSVADASSDHHQARKVSSRRDLQKQQKLSKRVSDLEGKLEAARRQLNEALAEPLPTPGQQRYSKPKFVPGAMPSLLSERLLSGYLPPDDQLTDDDEVGKAIEYPLPQKTDTEEARGRSESVGPDSKSNHWIQYSLTLGKRVPSSSPTKSSIKKKPIQAYNDDEDFEEAITKANQASTDISSAYIDDSAAGEENNGIEADESNSVVSNSEPVSEDTPGPKRKSTSLTPTPTEVQNQATAGARQPTVKTSAKKRKSLDVDDTHKPTVSDTGNSEVDPKSKIPPRRKAIGGGNNTAAPKRKSPPKRAPPPVPTSSTTPRQQQPPSKSLKTNSTSSPSTSHSAPPVSARNIGRKAINPPVSSSRLAKPNPVQNRGRQSVSPPPSSAFTGMENIKPVLLHHQDDGAENGSQTLNPNPYPSVHDSAIPPMPKLPKTVKLPNGEVVNVSARKPVAKKSGNLASSSSASASTTTSASKGNRASSRVRTRSERKEVGGELAGEERKGDGLSRKDIPPPSKTSLPKSDTKSSFEWPSDCF